MIEDVNGRIDEMLMNETQQREETEERLISLLETTCARVENSLRQN